MTVEKYRISAYVETPVFYMYHHNRKEVGMKKILCVLVLACVIMGGAFAQTKPAAAPAAPAAAPAASGGGSSAKVFKNSIGMDVVPFFAGLINWDEKEDVYKYTELDLSFSYERLIVSHFSIGGNMDISFGKMDYESRMGKDYDLAYFCLSGEGRYYPTANFDKFFVGAALGFNLFSFDGKTKEKDGGFFGLFFAVKTGYKVITSKGFYMEPSLSYILSEVNPLTASYCNPNGFQVGLRLGFSF
jgi:hypothetical protein